ncbi:hypothetical protein GOP47_0029612 [Adiantum capillus-veneris]|nr:hypothetical protein GOP47_0029612 [Adiantum capillus-veneris]
MQGGTELAGEAFDFSLHLSCVLSLSLSLSLSLAHFERGQRSMHSALWAKEPVDGHVHICIGSELEAEGEAACSGINIFGELKKGELRIGKKRSFLTLGTPTMSIRLEEMGSPLGWGAACEQEGLAGQQREDMTNGC